MKNIAGKRQILIYSHTTLNSLQIHKMHFHIPINLVTALSHFVSPADSDHKIQKHQIQIPMQRGHLHLNVDFIIKCMIRCINSRQIS